MLMMTLYQFPISHFCEKVRWALDYKHIDYQKKNLIPGLHTMKTKKLAARSSVPVLVHDEKVIQGSSSILTYLDETFAERRLSPENASLKEDALEWEKYVDKEIGIHVRRCCYHILLEHPDIVIRFFAQDGPWYGKIFLSFMFPKLRTKMRDLMTINAESAQISRERLGAAIDRIHAHLQKHKFLTGDQFSRADLAAAALLAPLCRPEKYGLHWPDHIPAQLQELTDEFREKTKWVLDVYDKFR